MDTSQTLKQHPQTWVGLSFENFGTKNVFKVKEVRRSRTGTRYRVLLDSPFAMLSEKGFDSRIFRKNFTPIKNG
jgi:hypothetical protein